MISLEELIRETFNLDSVTQILDSHGPGELEGWDSLGHVDLMLALESTYGVSFGLDEMLLMESVGDVKEMLENKGVTHD